MPDDKKPNTLEQAKDDKKHKELIDAIELDLKAIQDNHKTAANMQTFLSLDKHLTDEAEADRIASDRAIISIPVLNQFCSNLEGELKQNKFYPEVYPSDKKASKAVAAIIEGHIRQILYENNAESILDQAGVSAIECGFGALSADLKAGEEHKFDLEVIIRPEPDFQSIIPDCYAEADDYSDGKHITKFFRLTKEDFKKQYPKFELPSSEFFANVRNTQFEHWYVENTVAVAKHFKIITEKEDWVKLSDGTECLEEEAAEVLARDKKMRENAAEVRAALAELVKQQQELNQVMQSAQGGQPAGAPPPSQPPVGAPSPPAGGPPMQQQPEQPQPMPGMQPQEEEEPLTIVDRLTVESNKVQYYIITGHYILEGPTDWGSDYLPYLLELGKVRYVGKKRVVQGLVNKGVTGSRFLDKYFTEIADTLDRRIKAQAMVQAGHIAGYEREWAEANKGDSAALPTRVLEDSKMPVPIPLTPTDGGAGVLLNQIQQCKQVVSDAIGMHTEDVSGQHAAGESGAAIEARQKPGDTNTFSFIDNHQKFVVNLAKMLVDLIMHNYSNERDLKVRFQNGDTKRAIINVKASKALKAVTDNPELYGAMEQKDIEEFIKEHGAEAEYNSLKEGRYDVRVKAGLPYQTAREENNGKFRVFLQTIGSAPTPQNLLERYFVAKFMDGFEEYAEVLKMQCVAAGLLKPDEDEVDPAKEFMQRQQMIQQNNPMFKVEMGKIELEMTKAKTEQLKQQVLAAKLEGEGIKIHKEIYDTPENMKEMLKKILPEVIQEMGYTGQPA